ncbi:[FeFe] hydrogenase H-cluster maturation GTPase HydF [Clostridia bacterium]|nr:[FeFe] hydrogenase H-cluster maturation GTPase HydF [Clostridia bacterium]GHV37284.1 [FeFe] hydrogenase H-cluster maturation GTPase HydF [Clostridia bacterium]
MSMNETPSGERLHIGFFGRRNAGKSTVVNAVTGQDLSVVSDVKGTTTDPVKKAMELLPLGPVVIIDTPGMDDEGELGGLRVKKTLQTLELVDVAVLVADAVTGLTDMDRLFLESVKRRGIAHLVVFNKRDLADEREGGINVSGLLGTNIDELKEAIGRCVDTGGEKPRLIGDLIAPSDVVVLVTPIDSAAPKGRLILPQQQVVRDILEADALALVTKEFQLKDALASLKNPPRMVVTDSQAFAKVVADIPPDLPLTSFSILFARYKGLLRTAVAGARTLDALKDGDRLLICEGCTHHRQCDDIGTVKLPRWIRQYTGRELDFDFVSGGDFPAELSAYRLVVHCGGCMLRDRTVRYRMSVAEENGVPITNYGTAIAFMQGILERSVVMFE